MRHSMSVGGRFFPPPKYCSYSIFSWRMSFSSCPISSSTVLDMECAPHDGYAKGLKSTASTRRPLGGAEQTMFSLVFGERAGQVTQAPKIERGPFPSPFQQN